MRAAAFRWTTVIALGLLLLAATAMPMLSRMTCLMSGHSELRIGQPQDCCPPGDACGDEEVGATCCVFQQVMPLEERCVPAGHSPEPTVHTVPLGYLQPAVRHSGGPLPVSPCVKGPPLSAPERLSHLRRLRA